ncbi:MAG: crossover junction endodeoxyribonuclease RuvC, partial [Alphaproteobacteria bacterium]|nr:crossover junction endodeoxyribonuclease RuvC [Alphaproteobacteria bacterium]
MRTSAIRIIGLDPGLRNLGWGIIEADGSRLVFIACGTLHSDAKT